MEDIIENLFKIEIELACYYFESKGLFSYSEDGKVYLRVPMDGTEFIDVELSEEEVTYRSGKAREILNN